MIDLTLVTMLTSVAATVARATLAATREQLEITRIAKEEARAMLERSEATIIDVRTHADWNAGDTRIRGAVREDPNDIGSWADKYQKDQTLLLY